MKPIPILLLLTVTLTLSSNSLASPYYGLDSGPPQRLEAQIIAAVIKGMIGIVPKSEKAINRLHRLDVLVVRNVDEPLPDYGGSTWVESGYLQANGLCSHDLASPLVGCIHGRYHGSWISILALPPDAIHRINLRALQPEHMIPQCAHNARWFIGLVVHELLHHWYDHSEAMGAIEIALLEHLHADKAVGQLLTAFEGQRFKGAECSKYKNLLGTMANWSSAAAY